MKKLFRTSTMIACVLCFCLPAMAEVLVTGTVDKTKTVTVKEFVDITKHIDINATVNVTPDEAAETGTVVNAENLDNVVIKEGALGLETSSEIDNGAFDDSTGIIQVNQAPGNINNQGNATSIAVSLDSGEAAQAITNSQAAEADFNSGNSALVGFTELEDLIDFAFKNVSGVVNVNQAAGNLNNQHNTVAVSVGDGVVALSEADLGQFNDNNIVNEVMTYKYDTITGSAFENFSGVLCVNQSSGNMNNQSNIVSVSALTYPNPLQ
jgi:hypothetical protein